MQTCRKCQKLYADSFRSCPNCGGAKGLVGCVAGLAIVGVVFGVALTTGHDSSGDSTARWETFSGIQQGVLVALDIDSSTIERTADGSSASVIMKSAVKDELEKVTYICPSGPGRPGAVVFNGTVHQLPDSSASGRVMRRVCFGSVGHAQ